MGLVRLLADTQLYDGWIVMTRAGPFRSRKNTVALHTLELTYAYLSIIFIDNMLN